MCYRHLCVSAYVCDSTYSFKNVLACLRNYLHRVAGFGFVHVLRCAHLCSLHVVSCIVSMITFFLREMIIIQGIWLLGVKTYSSNEKPKFPIQHTAYP